MMTGWGVFNQEGGDIHVVPINDEKPHDLTPDCPCEPTIIYESGHRIYSHKAFDFREVREWIKEQAHG